VSRGGGGGGGSSGGSSELDAAGHTYALETALLLSSDVIPADVELGQRPLVTDRDISDNRDTEILFYVLLTFDGSSAAPRPPLNQGVYIP
jgi:hypothetical protein